MDEVGVLKHFNTAMAWMKQSEYRDALEDLRTRTPDGLTRDGFLADYAHVVLVSGFRYRVVESLHPELRLAFWGYDCDAIARSPEKVRDAALHVFGNKRKINGIIKTAIRLADSDWDEFKANATGLSHIAFLMRLPFIGPVTVHHLALSIGLGGIKDDVHLRRIAEEFGYGGGRDAVVAMAETIRNVIDEPLAVIDGILWRYEEQSRPGL